MRVQLFMLATGGCLLALAAQTSEAITYNLDSANFSGATSPYGSVTVSLGTDGAQSGAWITFQSDNNGTYQYLFGGNGSVGVNVSGSFSFVASSLTWSGQPQTGAAAPSYSPSSGTQDGFGNFDFTLNNTDGFSHSVEETSFFLAGTWSSDANVLTLNNKNFLAEGQIFVAAGNTFTNTGIGGNAAADQSDVVQTTPDGGSTVALLGSALAGVGILRRKLGKN